MNKKKKLTATRRVRFYDRTLPWYPRAIHTVNDEKQKRTSYKFYQGSIHRHVHARESAHVCVITVYESNMKLIIFSKTK